MKEAVASVAQKVASSAAAGPSVAAREKAETNFFQGLARPILRPRLLARRKLSVGARLIDGDERGDRGERKLEARAEQRLGLEEDHEEGREGEIAHRHRRPVEENRDQHDDRHDQRALRADARARREVVENGAEDRERRRPFLDRVIERERAREREDAPQPDEEDAGDEAHLNAGDRDDVKNPGLADELLGVVGKEVALAAHHRRGDRAGVALQPLIDARGERIAEAVDSREETQ